MPLDASSAIVNSFNNQSCNFKLCSIACISVFTLAACDGKTISNPGITNFSSTVQPVEHQAYLTRGGKVFIDLMRNNSTDTFNSDTLSVYAPPSTGDINWYSNTEVEFTHHGGTDQTSQFSYVVADHDGRYSAPVNVKIEIESQASVRTVAAVTAPSLAQPSTQILLDGRKSVSLNALQNISNANASTLQISQQGSFGYIRISGSTITYTPYSSQTEDSFSYSVKSNSGTVLGPFRVNLTRDSVAETPIEQPNTYSLNRRGSVTVNALQAIPNANPATLHISQQPGRGFLRISNGSITYKHYGTGTADEFSYSVKDNRGILMGPYKIYLSITNGTETPTQPVEPPAPVEPPVSPPGTNWWTPSASQNLNWQLQLQGDIRIINGVDVYAVDYSVSQASLNAAKATGAKVMCYLSAGSAENFRADFNDFPNSVIGNGYVGWPGEWWLDIRNINALAPIMRARIAACAAKGFDAIDADNVNVFENNSGFNVSRQDSINYIRWLANESHAQGLAFSLKNSETLVPDLINDVDMMQSEGCFIYGNCANAGRLSAANKPVFAVEYSDNMNTTTFNQACNTATQYNLEMIYRDRALTPTGVYRSCN